MPIEFTVIKGADGALRPATESDQEAMRQVKAGQAVKMKSVRLTNRSLQHHKLFFGGLMRLAFDYWEPTGGLITPAEQETIDQFARWLHSRGVQAADSVRAAGEAYLADMAQRRAQRMQAPEKSMDDLLEWVKIEVGHFDMIQTPRGLTRRTRSINFNAMSQEQFETFYKKAFTVIWRFVLSQSFDSEEQAQNAIDQMMAMG